MSALHDLPVCGLPGQDQGRREDGIRRLSRKGSNGFLQAVQGNTAVLVGHAADKGAVGQECNVHG